MIPLKYTFILIVTILLLLNTITYAIHSDTNSNSEAGILPGDFLYIFDVLFEKITYMLTFNTEKKINYLNSFANERQQELNSLNLESKIKYTKEINLKQKEIQTKIKELKEKQDIVNRPEQNNNTDIPTIEIIETRKEIIKNSTQETELNNTLETQDVPKIIQEPQITQLSEIEQYMCQSADQNNKCQTTLNELGFVTAETCCTEMNLCCNQ